MTTIYVGNLPFTATEDEVRGLFEKHGKVESVKLINDRETGRPRGFGFVDMAGTEAAAAIAQLNGFEMGGRPLGVNEAQERPSPGGRPGAPPPASISRRVAVLRRRSRVPAARKPTGRATSTGTRRRHSSSSACAR